MSNDGFQDSETFTVCKKCGDECCNCIGCLTVKQQQKNICFECFKKEKDKLNGTDTNTTTSTSTSSTT